MISLNIVFLIIIIIFIILIIYMLIETHILKITHHIFTSVKRPEKQKTDSDFITLMHFTDLHLGRTGISNDKILKAITGNKSDFLVFTGDYFEKDTQISKLFDLMDKIRGKYTKPIYLCFGNHDNRDVFGRYEGTREYVTEGLVKRNITILENESVTYSKGDLSIKIIGISDARSNTLDIPKIISKHSSDNVQIPNLLITHNSDILMKMNPGSVDFAIAGHTHGAQVWTPFNIETKLLHRKDILSSRQNIIRGYHRYNDIDLYISHGLGCSQFPIRFLSKPEIVIYKITY